MRPLLLRRTAARQTHSGQTRGTGPRHPALIGGSSYFQLLSLRTAHNPRKSLLEGRPRDSAAQVLYSLDCHNMSKINAGPEKGAPRRGEYRNRTDDLLHAMQAL